LLPQLYQALEHEVDSDAFSDRVGQERRRRAEELARRAAAEAADRYNNGEVLQPDWWQLGADGDATGTPFSFKRLHLYLCY
jgi:hypothetical protein